MRRNFFSEDFVRVISGSARGLKLSSPEGINTRPTLDRVKEALFSMLQTYLIDAVVLDLFSGSGALGLECLSRGAKKAVFVDNSQEAILCINSNLSSAKLADKSLVFKSDFCDYLENCNEKFDLIFLDPPYSKNFYKTALDLICQKKLLNDDGLIILEWDSQIGFQNEISAFEVYKEKHYGRANITVLKWGLT